MTSQCPTTFRPVKLSPRPATAYKAALLASRSEGHPQLAGSVPGKLTSAREDGGSNLQKKLTKLLVKVNIDGSLGPVPVVMSSECAVRDLVKAAIEIYAREKRRPLLKDTDPDLFELYYSQFSLECLRPDEKLKGLGSRNFFLCTKASASTSSSSSCAEEAKMLSVRSSFPLTN